MDFKRPSTPPLQQHMAPPLPPLTPGAPLPRTVIPPSPGHAGQKSATASLRNAPRLRTPPLSKHSQTVGVKKAAKTAKARIDVRESVEKVDKKHTTSLLDLPGEIRNLIYTFTSANARQALLVHRPRLASLRPRTRLDRHRPLTSSLTAQSPAAARRGKRTSTLPRETNRPFFSLTQVCQVLREEFRPMYLEHQEIGMDLVDVVAYLRAFYPEAHSRLDHLSTAPTRKLDMPFTGNLTIAVGDKVTPAECSPGTDVWPLLDVWANSFKMEAGFGRYMAPLYDATADGEAKDLYRLFGRRVQADRRCSAMNAVWRETLRGRALGGVRICRQKVGGGGPYIHILFKRERAEGWMMGVGAKVEGEWLRERGFGGMEFFEVRVGVV